MATLQKRLVGEMFPELKTPKAPDFLPPVKRPKKGELSEKRYRYRHISGDLMDLHEDGWVIALPVNCDVKSNGMAVMGKGLALQFARKYPKFPAALGKRIRIYGGAVCHVLPEYNVITVPTKYHWDDEKASLSLISNMMFEVDNIIQHNHKHYGGTINHIFMPKFGCGKGTGNLNWVGGVEDIIVCWAHNDSFYTVVSPKEEYDELYNVKKPKKKVSF